MFHALVPRAFNVFFAGDHLGNDEKDREYPSGDRQDITVEWESGIRKQGEDSVGEIFRRALVVGPVPGLVVAGLARRAVRLKREGQSRNTA